MKTEDDYRLLADAGRVLASSLDFSTTLANVSKLIVPRIADWFAVDLINEAGGLERVHVSHADPVKLALAHELFAKYPPQRDASRGQWNVIRTGQAEWSAAIDDSWLEAMAPHPDHRRAVNQFALRSYIRVPLSAEGMSVGVLTVVQAESGRSYDQADVAPIEQLGTLVALAVQNARTHTRLRELTGRKDEFLATLAHELRNPLSPIITASQVLEASASDATRVRNVASVIQRQARHMSALVEDLLDVVRVGRGDFAFVPETMDLSGPVFAAVEQIRPELEKRQHRLELTGVDRQLWVKGDRTRLVQVLVNLLGNAARYTPVEGRISLEVGLENGHAVVKVRDNGIGIAPEFLPHVFDLFSQHARSHDRTDSGLGLGLTLVKRLVDRHGGTVYAESQGPGMGSCFTVSLPQAEAPAMEPAGEAIAPQGRARDPAGI